MEADVFVVQVAESDQQALTDLVETLRSTDSGPAEDLEIVRVHPFDGQVLLQVAIPLTPATLVFFATWIRQRYQHKREQKVMFDGGVLTEATGYSADEVVKFLEARALGAADSSDSSSSSDS